MMEARKELERKRRGDNTVSNTFILAIKKRSTSKSGSHSLI